QGKFKPMVDLARKLQNLAADAGHRGRAMRLEGAGWEGLGRYNQTLQVLRRALQIPALPADERISLQGNLAHPYYSLWDLTSACGTTQVVLDYFNAKPPKTRAQRAAEAFGYYVRGHAQRRMLTLTPEDALDCARRARADLDRSAQLYEKL